MKLFAIATTAAQAWEQPNYFEALEQMKQRSDGWGAPVNRIAALHSLCSPLTPPANAQIACDQSTCALVCDQGYIGVGKRRTKCRWNATNQFFWKKQLGTCETCSDLTAPAHLVQTCTFSVTGKKKCKYTCPAGENMTLPGSSVQPKVFSTVCKCPRGTNPRVCGWWGRKFSTTMAATQADIDAITCIEGTATTPAPTTTTTAAASTTAAPPSSTTTGPPASTTAEPPASTTAPAATTTGAGGFSRTACISQLTSDGHADPEEACDAIILHNTYRANHNAAPFGIPSASLCQGAQDWADSEAAANAAGHTGMTHATSEQRPGQGENMAWSGATSGFSLSDATTLWQAEDAYWNFDDHQECIFETGSCPSCDFGPNPNSFGDCGHFTQNVWKATTSVCVAKAVNSQGTYVVARYEPAGNLFGTFVNNVDSQGPLNGIFVGQPHGL